MSESEDTQNEIAQGEDRVIHSVDGIEEYDNRLPRWWLYTLYGAIGFAVVYWYTYQVGRFADLPAAEYEAELDRAAALEEKKNAGAPPVTPEALVALSRDPAIVAQGKAIFASTCAQCHRADGGGNVGPNLTDEFWLHGGAPEKIMKTVSDGVAEKGMPAWRPQLGTRRVQAVTAFVITLRNTNVPQGKPPQGERETISVNP